MNVSIRKGYITLDGVERPILASGCRPPTMLAPHIYASFGHSGMIIDILHTRHLIASGRDMSFRPEEWAHEALVRHVRSNGVWMP